MFLGKVLCLVRLVRTVALSPVVDVDVPDPYDVLVYGANAAGVRPRKGPNPKQALSASQ